MFFCICSQSEKNRIHEITQEDADKLTAKDILEKYAADYQTLFLKGERFAYPLKPEDTPFTIRPSLLLSEQPGPYVVPANCLYVFTNVEDTSRILYLLPKHSTTQEIPRLTVIIPESDFTSKASNLSSLIEKSFLSPVTVNEILINDNKVNNDDSIQTILESAEN